MEDLILKHLGRKNYVPANVPELLEALNMERNEQQELQQSLKDLERHGEIARIKGNRYVIPNDADLIAGRLQVTRSGRGFLVPDDPDVAEISVSSRATNTAFNDDRVLVRVDVQSQGLRTKKPNKDKGSVIRVLERRRTRFVGTLRKSRQFFCVELDDPRLQHSIYVPDPKKGKQKARVGDKVLVELIEWNSRHENPEGKIIEVIGKPGDLGVDMLGVLRQYELSSDFPEEVIAEVERFGNKVKPSDLKERIDCRDHMVVTIDPDDAKDFDDAICLKPLAENRWKLWVHIADVSHYVKRGSALDEEAHRRGNSSYLVDRVIPMLPEALSNELCSLKPDVDRLTKCVEFIIEDNGKVVKSRCFSAVIHSKRRYTYEEAMKIISRKPDGKFEKMLHAANTLAQRIRARRFKAGSLEMDFPESKIRLNEQGKISRIDRMDNDESHHLIEEFMLLANEAVASKLMGQNIASIYRIHEAPDEARLNDYRQEVLSHHVPCGNLNNPKEVQKLLKRLSKLPIGDALKIGFLKSMSRARYSVKPLGHYGLAKEKYTHFTSPIRRYADLIVHRSLFEKKKINFGFLKLAADHISATERNSADAERDSRDVKMYAYLEEQLKSGRPFRYQALVTGLRNFGFQVDIPNLGISGLVPLSLLKDDFYEYDVDRNEIRGRRKRRIVKAGDQLIVEIARANLAEKMLDFKWIPESDKKRPSKKRSKGSSKHSEKKSDSRQKEKGDSRQRDENPPRKRTRRRSPRKRS